LSNSAGTDVMGREVHVKDAANLQGWAFFGFEDDKPAKMIPRTADCYSCHAAHAAVDNTFVQFYPTLLPIATAKGTLSTAYKTESAAKNRPRAGRSANLGHTYLESTVPDSVRRRCARAPPTLPAVRVFPARPCAKSAPSCVPRAAATPYSVHRLLVGVSAIRQSFGRRPPDVCAGLRVI
jgi:hypothetical protein